MTDLLSALQASVEAARAKSGKADEEPAAEEKPKKTAKAASKKDAVEEDEEPAKRRKGVTGNRSGIEKHHAPAPYLAARYDHRRAVPAGTPLPGRLLHGDGGDHHGGAVAAGADHLVSNVPAAAGAAAAQRAVPVRAAVRTRRRSPPD